MTDSDMTKQLWDIKITLHKITQQQKNFQQVVNPKTASLADISLSQHLFSNTGMNELTLQKIWLQEMSQRIEKVKSR